MKCLTGKKTYLSAVLIGIASVAHYLGWIDTNAYMLIIGILGAGTAASMRHAIKKSE